MLRLGLHASAEAQRKGSSSLPGHRLNQHGQTVGQRLSYESLSSRVAQCSGQLLRVIGSRSAKFQRASPSTRRWRMHGLRLRNSNRDHIDRLDAANQRVAAGVIHLHLQELTGLASISVKDDDSITVRAAGHLDDVSILVLSTLFARTFDQHFDGLADQLRVVLFRDRVLHSQQFVVAARFHFTWNVVRQIARRPWFPGERCTER